MGQHVLFQLPVGDGGVLVAGPEGDEKQPFLLRYCRLFRRGGGRLRPAWGGGKRGQGKQGEPGKKNGGKGQECPRQVRGCFNHALMRYGEPKQGYSDSGSPTSPSPSPSGMGGLADRTPGEKRSLRVCNPIPQRDCFRFSRNSPLLRRV